MINIVDIIGFVVVLIWCVALYKGCIYHRFENKEISNSISKSIDEISLIIDKEIKRIKEITDLFKTINRRK
jgi:hypothetical protein